MARVDFNYRIVRKIKYLVNDYVFDQRETNDRYAKLSSKLEMVTFFEKF